MKGFIQAINPNPNVPCQPGWCLTYLDDCFNLEAHGKTKNYPTAVAAWEASQHKHADQDFPDGCSVPVFFTLSNVPAGHVALRAPDGSIWSSSHPTSNKPVHHKSLDDLYSYYGRGRLSYLGWTEDLTGILVIKKEVTMLNKEAVKFAFWLGRNSDPDENEYNYWVGRKPEELLSAIYYSPYNHEFRKGGMEYPAVLKERDELQKKLDDALKSPVSKPNGLSDSDKKLQAIKDALDIK